MSFSHSPVMAVGRLGSADLPEGSRCPVKRTLASEVNMRAGACLGGLGVAALLSLPACAVDAGRAPIEAEPEPAHTDPPPPARQASDFTACLQPLGSHDPELLDAAARGVAALYGFTTEIREPAPLPDSAWYAPRQRYRADALLDHLDRRLIPGSGCNFIVGFTSQDISTTKPPHQDWGIFGLGNIGGPSAVVSTYRLAGWPQATAGRRLVGQRTVKVVNHELGHVLGMGHLDGDGCLMNDAQGRIATVDSEHGLLCEHERDAVQRLIGAPLPTLERFDWDAVLEP